MIAPSIDAFLSQTRVAVITTIGADGYPRSTPIWYVWENGAAYMFTARTSLKWRNLQRAAKAALCVDERQHPYAGVRLHGDVEAVDRSLYELVRGMAVRYYGQEQGEAFAADYRDDHGNTVVFKLEPVGLSAFGLG